jgi:hypothetical protein
MPTKHISQKTWKKVEQRTIEIVTKNQKITKESEVLDYLINKGLEQSCTQGMVMKNHKK